MFFKNLCKITLKNTDYQTKRIYNDEQEDIVKKYVEKDMDISIPMLLVGYKDNNLNSNMIKKDIAISILGNLLFSKSSKFFEELYESGKITIEPSMDYEFSKTYAHVMIQAKTEFIDDVLDRMNLEIENLKSNGINIEDFERAKRKIYGELVKDYNEVSTIASGLVSDYFKKIDSFDYFEDFKTITKEFVEETLNEIFIEKNKVVSAIKPK